MDLQDSLFDVVLRDPELLRRLVPSGISDFPLLQRIRDCTDSDLVDPAAIRRPELVPLLRCALFYSVDALDDAHRLAQDVTQDEGSYWHGMIHRREGDFDNARYWFRRAGSLSFFDNIQARVAQVSAEFAAQMGWEPYLFVGQCEQERFGAEDLREGLLQIQRIEFEVALAHLRHRVG